MDEVADGAGEGGAGAGRADRAEQQIGLACVAVEQRLEGGEQDDERRRPTLPGQTPDLASERLDQGKPVGASGGALDARPWPVGRQIEDRQLARQALAPVGPESLASGTGEL